MRSPALKGWGDALLSFNNPFASFRLERTGRNCSTLFYCQALNATNFFISVCLPSNMFLLSNPEFVCSCSMGCRYCRQQSTSLAEDWITNTFENKYEIYEKLRKLNTSIRAKFEKEQASPCLKGARIFLKSRKWPKIPGAMKQIPYWGPTSI